MNIEKIKISKHSIDLYSRAKRSGQSKINLLFAALCRDNHTTIEEIIPNGKYCVQQNACSIFSD